MNRHIKLFTPPILLILIKRFLRQSPSILAPQSKLKINKAFIGKNTSISGKLDIRHPNGRIVIGANCLIEALLVTETNGSTIEIANNVFIGDGTILDSVNCIRIEEDVLISYRCIICDSDNHSTRYSFRKNDLVDWRNGGQHDWATTLCSPVLIRRGAWIGAQCIILKGVTIGEGSVVGAGSVVTKDVPDWCIVAGNPARVVKEIPENVR